MPIGNRALVRPLRNAVGGDSMLSRLFCIVWGHGWTWAGHPVAIQYYCRRCTRTRNVQV